MHSFRRLALLLALVAPALPAVQAQSSSSSSSTQNQVQPPTETPQELSVQERIRMRRQQRRMTAIHDTYDHLYESYLNLGYLRFKPGPDLQRLTYYAWDTGLTRYYNERLGVNFDARGYYGMAYVGLNYTNDTRYRVSQYDLMIGPTYRFYLQPKYSISGRVMGGWALGDFSGDTNGFPPTSLGLYPDGNTFSASAAIIGDYNFTPNMSLRLAPEYFFTGFGSSNQSSRGFTIGIAYRFGKQ